MDNLARTPGGRRVRLFLAEAVPLIALAALVLAVFRGHVTGTRIYLGNFDRLNSFLNTLLFQVRGWHTGTFSAWDDSMFMGRNAYALPFTFPNALNLLQAAFGEGSFYQVAGDISISLLILAGWSGYLFIRSLVQGRFAAFVGAALYQFSALAVLKVSQNDMSFAVLIQIPLLLWLVRNLGLANWRRSFVALSLVLSHLLFFCFLQKVAYALLVFGIYSLFVAFSRRSWLVLATVAASVAVALVAAFPRVYGIIQELKQLQRITPGYDLTNFDALYRFQNFHPFEALRWFNDGLFGRYYGETLVLSNNINTTEGTLMFMGMFVPFIVLSGLAYWRGRWLGLFRRAQREWLVFYLVITVVFAVITSKSAYHLMFILFLKMDFTHTRIVIAALPLISAIVAVSLEGIWLSVPWSGARQLGSAVIAGVLSIAALISVQRWAEHSAPPGPIPLTDSSSDALQLLLFVAKHAVGLSAPLPATHGAFLAWMLPSAVFATVMSAGAFLLFLAAARLCRGIPAVRWLMTISAGSVLVGSAWLFANFQVNGPQLKTQRPFADSNSYYPRTGEFAVPSATMRSAVRTRLDADAFRSVFFGAADTLPYFVSPHLGAAWQLRQIDGYSSGVPHRLASLPWPRGVLGLRTITFMGIQAKELPWPLLAFLNVRYAIRPSEAFYKGLATLAPQPSLAGPDSLIAENPLKVVPRVFFAEQVSRVSSPAMARSGIISGPDSAPRFIDPTRTSLVEISTPLPDFDAKGNIVGNFSGDHIHLRFPASPNSRALIINDLYHPDWKAEAAGRPLPVFPANLVMRAIIVPPNVDSISLQFVPFCNLQNVTVFMIVALVLAYLTDRVVLRPLSRRRST